MFNTKILRNTNLKQTGHFVGTMMLASISALEGRPQTPKDDLESLFIVLTFLKNGTLSWLKFKIEIKINI